MNMKSYNRREFLKGTLGLGAAGMLTCMTGIGVSAEEKGEAVYTPGTYTSEAHGHSSNVVVSVTFSETSIVDIRIDASSETENIGGLAVPILTDQIMKAQSSAIDGVSSATITSNAVKQAVADCIYQASGGRIQEGGSIVSEAAPTPGQFGKDEWLGEAPRIREDKIVRTINTEVLVVCLCNNILAGIKCCPGKLDHDRILLKRQAFRHLIREGQLIGAVCRDAARQRRAQRERYIVADVVVRAVLKSARLACCVIFILRLLLKLRYVVAVRQVCDRPDRLAAR